MYTWPADDSRGAYPPEEIFRAKTDDSNAIVVADEATTNLTVGVATCGDKTYSQSWLPLPLSGKPSLIQSVDQHCCISALSCIDCWPGNALSCVACNISDVYQLFEYNMSNGAVGVLDAAKPHCPDKGPYCWNLDWNFRKPGIRIDIIPCVYPLGDALLTPGNTSGTIELRDAETLCLSAAAAPTWPPPPGPAPTPAPPPYDHEFDDDMRILAFQVAADRLGRADARHGPRNLRSVWDSLEFSGSDADDLPPRPPAATLPTGASVPLPTNAIYVDWRGGNDQSSGAVSSPLKTLEFALQLSIAAGAPPRPIMLRNGTHQLRSTLEIGPRHSGLHLSAFPGEQATLSGGVELSVDFTPATVNGGVQALVASLLPFVSLLPGVRTFTELFVDDGNANALNLNRLSRYTKARWPDGNPETDAGLCTTTNGCKAYSTAAGSCGTVPFVNGTWIEIGPPLSPRRSSWNAVMNCPDNVSSVVFDADGRCGQGKCCVGFVYDDYIALEGGSAAGRFKPPLTTSGSVIDQQAQTNCVDVKDFSPRGLQWNLTSGRRWPLLHTFNYGLGSAWGNHMFEVTKADLEMVDASRSVSGNLSLSERGGWHLTAAAAAAHSFFVEDVKEELTVPGEWYLEDHDEGAPKLWLVPNSSTVTSASGPTRIVLTGLNRLINIRGQGTEPVRDISIDGLSFTHTAQTYVPVVGGPYEVPSNGDWSILREGAIWIGGAENISVSNSLFWRLGGNALVLSDAARGCNISGNEFGFLGENAVVSVGSAELNDATKPTYPRNNVIQFNHMHDIGLWTKQVAGYTQFLTARATVQSNVIYNCPRAGINLNDSEWL
jgi:hypothetical protein